MTFKRKNLNEYLNNGIMPKRILALDGGGLRGILTLGILQKIENILQERYGNNGDLRLSHDFNLIAGTSTGAIIAAILANVDLREESVRKLNPGLTDSEMISSLSDMDVPENMNVLHRLGVLAAELDVNSSDF